MLLFLVDRLLKAFVNQLNKYTTQRGNACQKLCEFISHSDFCFPNYEILNKK